MARKVKCPECGTFNDKENTVQHSSKYYCKICYENKQKESQDYKQLISYICDLYKIEIPSGWMLKQIKEFKEHYKYSYKGMKTTLHYFYEIQEGNDASDSMGVGIIPFVYDEAKKFYIDKKAVKDSIVGCDLGEMENNKKTVKIHRDKSQHEENNYKNLAIIDIEKL